MHSLSVERDADTQALNASESSSCEDQYATGPEKPARCEICKFRSRIPHYIWTNRPVNACSCSCTQPRCTSGDKRVTWQTCRRVGNFTVVLERVTEITDLESAQVEVGGGSGHAASEYSKLYFVLGPHWPFALVFTGGLLVGFPLASIGIFWGVVPDGACYALLGLTAVNLALLASIGCGDPGIAKRLHEKPVGGINAFKKWLWNDQANTWRASTDSYSQEMNAVLHDVDHICPFTGTAISRRNMRRFIAFQLAVILLASGVVVFIAWGLIISMPAMR